MRIGLGAEAARRNVNEIITGLWEFANAQGLLTNDIGERTAASGVTVDGLLIKDAGIPEVAVTAHEAALAILMSQVTGNIPDGQVPASAVTQHEAALTILETQIADGTLLARLAAAENITAEWTFDEAIHLAKKILSNAHASAAASVMEAGVTGDTVERFKYLADGKMSWGDGSGVVDTNLFRNAANELQTDDDFNVQGALDLGGDLEISQRTPATFAVNQDDFVTGTETVQIVENTSGSAKNLSGFAGGRTGRVIIILLAVGSEQCIIKHQSTASLAANRIIMPNAADITLQESETVTLWYFNDANRWIVQSIQP